MKMHIVVTLCLLIVCGIVNAVHYGYNIQNYNSRKPSNMLRTRRSFLLPYPYGYHFNPIEPPSNDFFEEMYSSDSQIDAYNQPHWTLKKPTPPFHDQYNIFKNVFYPPINSMTVPIFEPELNSMTIPHLTPEDNLKQFSTLDTYRQPLLIFEHNIAIKLLGSKDFHDYRLPSYQPTDKKLIMLNSGPKVFSSLFPKSEEKPFDEESNPIIKEESIVKESNSIPTGVLYSNPITTEDNTIENETNPVTTEVSITENESNPVTSEESLTENESNIFTTEENLTESELNLVTTEDNTTENETNPVTTEESLTENESNPVTSEERLTENESNPVTIEVSLTENETNLVTTEESLTENESNPVTSEESLTENESNPVTIDESLIESESNPITIDESLIESESNPITIDESLTESESNPVPIDESLTESESNPVPMDESLTESESNPVTIDENSTNELRRNSQTYFELPNARTYLMNSRMKKPKPYYEEPNYYFSYNSNLDSDEFQN